MTQAELLTRERDLACDIVESGLQLHYFRLMHQHRAALAARATQVHKVLRASFESGALSSQDYADGCRLQANAVASERQMNTRVVDLADDLRLLTGLNPDRVEVEMLLDLDLVPFRLPENPAADITLAGELALSHTAVLGARWGHRQSEAEWRQSQSRSIPWPTHLAAGYAWWEGNERGDSSSEKTGDETKTTTSSSTETETDTGSTSSTETETPSGDVTDSEQSSTQSSTTDSQSTETEYETYHSSSSSSSYSEYDGHEWWVEVGINVPIFEWMSGESRLRRHAATAAGQATGRIEHRIRANILAALRATRSARHALAQSVARIQERISNLRGLAVAAREQGVAGDMEALRIEEGIADLNAHLLGAHLQEALARVDLVRAAGLAPLLTTSEAPHEEISDEER